MALPSVHAEVSYSYAEGIALYDFAWKTCGSLYPQEVAAERGGMQARWSSAGLTPEILDRIRASADYRRVMAEYANTKENLQVGCASTYGKSR
ncbi:MAG: hypothetical protein EBR49_02865 [Betaproteobacteria bacterium]|nr:hypothetical protein [Betaproteobacteria bacterium]